MGEELKKLIKNYGVDMEDELDVSPFEYSYTFRNREYLAKNYKLLSNDEKELLQYYDSILLSRAKEFYDYLKPIKIWGESSISIKYWWYHLDKVISGKLKINLKENKLTYEDKIIKL